MARAKTAAPKQAPADTSDPVDNIDTANLDAATDGAGDATDSGGEATDTIGTAPDDANGAADTTTPTEADSTNADAATDGAGDAQTPPSDIPAPGSLSSDAAAIDALVGTGDGNQSSSDAAAPTDGDGNSEGAGEGSGSTEPNAELTITEINAATIVPMAHPDGGTSDRFEQDDDGNILVPVEEIAVMMEHGFLVVYSGDG